MEKASLQVWRDLYTHYEHVGSLAPTESGWRFEYDADYSGQPISVRLPVRPGSFSEEDTRIFFSALSPEGSARAGLLRELRASPDEYEPLIRRLNDESQGALVFTVDDVAPGSSARYEKLDDGFFDRFTSSPAEVAVETMGLARLSLSGAMAKTGLYRSPQGEWYLPVGAAPSTHIVKAGGNSFPLEVLNEALCLETARRCGYDVPHVEVLEGNGGLLLAVERYDRAIGADARKVDDLPVPMRLHQEDFCQVCGLLGSMKYEPTEGEYLARAATQVGRCCANGFGETMLFVSYVLFDYLIGNCDNHLKNYSILYSNDWNTLEMAPRYDVVCTTVYPRLAKEMGVSLQRSRSILGLTPAALESAIMAAKLPVPLVMSEFDELSGTMPGALESARDSLVAQGFEDARRVADTIRDGMMKRISFAFEEGDALSLESG